MSNKKKILAPYTCIPLEAEKRMALGLGTKPANALSN